MSDRLYTRKGIVGGQNSEEYKPIKTYRIPTEVGDEIRINIPDNASQRDICKAVEIMQIIAKYREEVVEM